MVNSPLIRPYFLGGWHRGVPLDSHEMIRFDEHICFKWVARNHQGWVVCRLTFTSLTASLLRLAQTTGIPEEKAFSFPAGDVWGRVRMKDIAEPCLTLTGCYFGKQKTWKTG